MARRELKKELLTLLAGNDLSVILEGLAGYRERQLITPLFSALCHIDELVRWHAVSVFGRIVARLARQDMESARIVMRRFLWSLNDESGGIGWGAPEAMAEAMFRHKALADEYLHMLVSYMREDGPELFQDGNYIELPMLQRGLLWGIDRLIGRYRHRLEEMGVTADLKPYLLSEDGDVRGLAVRGLGRLGAASLLREFPGLTDDRHQVRLYSEEGFTDLTVAELVRQARTADRGGQ
jgi:hypothetical protein